MSISKLGNQSALGAKNTEEEKAKKSAALGGYRLEVIDHLNGTKTEYPYLSAAARALNCPHSSIIKSMKAFPTTGRFYLKRYEFRKI